MAPKHIEFVGLPGSGKTTIAKELSSRQFPRGYLLRTGYKLAVCRSVLPRSVAPVGRYIPLELVDMLARRSQTTPGRTETDSFLDTAKTYVETYSDDRSRQATVSEWLCDLSVQYTTARATLSSRELLFCDEGFMQRAVATFCPPDPCKALDDAEIRAYLSEMPTPDLIVVLDVPIDLAQTRMRSRPQGVPESVGDQSARRLRRIQRLLDSQIELLEELELEYITMTNDSDVVESCQQIASHIERLESA